MELNTNYQLLGKVTIPSSVSTTEVRLYAKIGTQNIASNYTPVTSKIAFYRGTGNYQASSWSTNLTGDVSGSNSGGGTFYAGETTLLETTQNIYHNQDGTKGINIGAYYNDSFQGKNKTIGNVYVTLPTIPRASKLGNIPDFVVDGNEGVGVPFSVPYTKYYDGFKQCLIIDYGADENYVVIAKRDNFNERQVTFTSEELNTFYSKCVNGNKLEVRFILVTYTGESYQGTNYEQIGISVKFRVGASLSTTGLLPTLDLSSITYEDINTDTKVVTGNNQLIIQNASRLKTSISQYATAHKGATISSYRIETTTKAGIERKDFASNSPLPMTTNFNKPTTNQFTVKVFDSRGNQSTYTKTYDLINWVEPVISKFEVSRTNGVEEATYIEANGTYSTLGSLGNNIEEAYYRYREVGTTTWSSEQQLTLPSSSEGKWTLAKVYVADFDVSKEYEFELYIRDRIGTNKSTDTLNSATPYMWHKRKSKLLGIGKKPKDGLPEGSVDIAGGYYVNGTKLSFTQKQADWKQTNTSAVDYIKNKPTIPTIPTKDIISLWLPAYAAVTHKASVNNLINLVQKEKIGTKLSYDSTKKGVKIGAGVSKVKISANMCYAPRTATTIRLGIAKNGSTISEQGHAHTIANTENSINAGTLVFSVAQNDVITLVERPNDTVTIDIWASNYNCFLTVEVIQ